MSRTQGDNKGSGGGSVNNSQVYGTRILTVDASATAITGVLYNTVQAAINYAVTQTPSAASPWLIQIRSGIYSGAVTLAQYVNLIGEGTVEIQLGSGFGVGAVTLGCSNVRLYNITARATGGATMSALRVSGDQTDFEARDCRFIVDVACTSNTDGIMVPVNSSLSGKFYDCYIEAPYDAARICSDGLLQFFHCTFVGTQSTGYRVSGFFYAGGNGVVELWNCNHSANVQVGTAYASEGITCSNVDGPGTLKLYGCRLRAVNATTGDTNGIGVSEGGTDVITVEAHDCRFEAVNTSTGTTSGLYTTGVNVSLTVTGGSTSVLSGGSAYDAKRVSGTITLRGVITDGKINGTVSISNVGVPTTLVVAASDSLRKGQADYVCTGAGDQTIINTALNALPATGGRVLLLEGTYNITDSIAIPSYQTLEGQGYGTLLQLDASITGATQIVRNYDTTNGNTNITIKGLHIDGSLAQAGCVAAQKGIYLYRCTYCTVENNYIEHLGNVDVVSCIGINPLGCTDSIFTGNHVIDTVDNFNTSNSTYPCYRLTVENNHFMGTSRDYPMNLYYCHNSTIIGNEVGNSNTSKSNIHVYYSNDNLISNNYSYNAGADCILVEITAARNKISNNVCRGGTYGIRVASTAGAGNQITGNDLTNSGTIADLYLIGAPTTTVAWGNTITGNNDFRLLNGNMGVGNLATVTSPAGTPATSGGSMADGTYYYVITALDLDGGETIITAQTDAITITGGGGAGKVTLSWTAVTNAESYKVYRSTTQSVYTTPAYIANPTTNAYVDTANAPSAGAPPTINTAYTNKINPSGNSWINGGSLKLNSLTALKSVMTDANKKLISYGAFGDGFFGNAEDAATTTINDAGTTTLTRAMFYNNLTISNNSTLKTAGYRIFVAGTLTIEAGSSIIWNGLNGADALGSGGIVGGVGGATLTATEVGGSPGGSTGANSAANFPNGAGSQAAAATASVGMGGNGAAGGKGGNGGASSGGAARTGTATTYRPFCAVSHHIIAGATLLAGGTGGAGGSSGGNDVATYKGGAGGGGGSAGGVVAIFAKNIVNGGTISANGGNGGAGHDGLTGVGITGTGGGGGGGAGSGGVIILFYETLTGAGTISVAAGTVGAAGNGQGTGTAGDPGAAGNAGKIIKYNFLTGVWASA